ncbi:hypothetical protein BS78_09G090700 [Paspalum vaginatum]|nr:hypothetical protein BS78_09G090700 [Paspalum vaginatum]
MDPPPWPHAPRAPVPSRVPSTQWQIEQRISLNRSRYYVPPLPPCPASAPLALRRLSSPPCLGPASPSRRPPPPRLPHPDLNPAFRLAWDLARLSCARPDQRRELTARLLTSPSSPAPASPSWASAATASSPRRAPLCH